jgi:hypothetical protein
MLFTLSALPMVAQSNTLREEPKRETPKVAKEDPNRMKLRSDSELPKVTRSSTLSEDPIRESP